ncbi:MAG TPA: Ppx/GppA family phosphatase, partial [Methylovirgula sp.]
GTSGTVTTIGGIFLNLPRYDRRRVDGLWMSDAEIDTTVKRLRRMSYAERAANGCIGVERADLVLAGCAILEAIRRAFPARRVRIADRGLREGILLQLMDTELARSSR